MKKQTVNLGIVGLGTMGSAHARSILGGQVPRLRLAAVADIDPDRLTPFPDVAQFASATAMIGAGGIDAILVATPHYSHTTIGIEGLAAGLHVMVEKPISVHKADAERLIAAHRRKRQVFAAMFNQRTDPSYRRIRELVQAGELGTVRRFSWTITNWFRTDAYYQSSSWRATWAGEGGGILLNQCPHNLDLLQWLVGMPRRVRAFCHFGRHHDIEVEDDVTAYLEYASGTTGVFIASTGEAPGCNRLEIAGDRGLLVHHGDELQFRRNEVPAPDFCRTSDQMFAAPPTWEVRIAVGGPGDQHVGILRNFVAAILDREPLIAPAAEGLRSVELANAMIFSALKNATVELPLDARAYARALGKLAAGSRYHRRRSARPTREIVANLADSFGR